MCGATATGVPRGKGGDVYDREASTRSEDKPKRYEPREEGGKHQKCGRVRTKTRFPGEPQDQSTRSKGRQVEGIQRSEKRRLDREIWTAECGDIAEMVENAKDCVAG